MERDIMADLVRWKDRKDRKPLLVTGIRQCGKTHVLKEFGARYFEDVAYYYFEGNTGLASVFAYDFDTSRILNELGNVMRGKEIVPGRTLVIFDEIQACPRAITALKYFCETMRELHIVCAGSLLGVSLKRDGISFPVGKVNRLQMYPMTFSEFLRADGMEAVLKGAAGYPLTQELPSLYTEALSKELKYYYIVGGMPEVVRKWCDTHQFEEVEELQQEILDGYSNDFAKYAPRRDVPKLGWIWDSVPQQLARDNHKFVFSHVKAGKRSAELEDALEWLTDAGLVYRLEMVENPGLPLSFYANATFFKVYLADVGLLRKQSGIAPGSIMDGNRVFSEYKGALTENYVLTQLIAMDYHPYYWRSGNTAELDFLFEDRGRIIPLESKAEISTRAKSYLQFCKNYEPELGFRCSMKNVGVNAVEKTRTVSFPLYLMWRLEAYLKTEGDSADNVPGL